MRERDDILLKFRASGNVILARVTGLIFMSLLLFKNMAREHRKIFFRYIKSNRYKLAILATIAMG